MTTAELLDREACEHLNRETMKYRRLDGEDSGRVRVQGLRHHPGAGGRVIAAIRQALRRWRGIESDCPCEPHDYHVKNGGDGFATHFYFYTCWNCGKMFRI